MLKTILIHGGTTVIGQQIAKQDVLIQGEKILAVGQLASLSNIEVDKMVNADGLLLLPGGVDSHVHFNDDFMGTVSVHDYFHGTRAAAFGGTTSVIDFSNQGLEPEDTLMGCLEDKFRQAAGKAHIDWSVHTTIMQPNPRTLNEIKDVVAAGAPTIKCYMTYRDEGLLMEEAELRLIQPAIRDAGAMLLLHAEDNEMAESGIERELAAGNTAARFHASSKPVDVENAAIKTVINLLDDIGGRIFIVHLTTAEGVDLISQARAKGLDLLTETCTHYLVFTDEVLAREDGIKWVCSPPLRDKRAQDKLWAAIRDGRVMQVTSDDAAYWWKAKEMGLGRFDHIPNGIPGIEPRFQLLYTYGVATGRISLPRFVELISSNPARIFGFTHKGQLQPGYDADIVLFDPNQKWTMSQANSHSPNDWHAYDGLEMVGKIQQVYSRGKLIVDGDDFLGDPNHGRFVKRILPSEPFA